MGDLHGSAPDTHEVALVLIDVINDLEFPEGDELLARARPMASALRALKRRCKAAGIPAIYVNDNFGRWRSDFNQQVQHCLRDGVRGRPIVEQLLPEDDDYFVLKPMVSGFFSTTLHLLLRHLESKTLILTGLATNICVLYTAVDAHMRGFELIVPGDCAAANTGEEHAAALDQLRRVLGADVRPSRAIALPPARARPLSDGAAPPPSPR
ncbi:MAG TPA: isochorismatase family cysteine hydrolase [Polyangia bacterium]|nr:isochorismatase family cysteine hydrolase [Polyangia bacterium]